MIERKEINEIAESLALKAIKAAKSRSNELDRFCWMFTHEYCNGVMPVEYDIREVDEDLYLQVLKIAKSKL